MYVYGVLKLSKGDLCHLALIAAAMHLYTKVVSFAHRIVSLILGGLGVALVNGESHIGKSIGCWCTDTFHASGNFFLNNVGQAAGVVFTLSTLLFLVYALWRFYQRADRLQKRESGSAFEDRMGTMLVIVVVLFAVGANLIMRLVELKGK